MGGPGSSTTICVIRAGVLESVSIQKRKTQIVRLQADRMRQYPVIAPGSSLSTRPSLLNYVLIGFPPASECMMSGLRKVAQGESDSSAGSVPSKSQRTELSVACCIQAKRRGTVD